MPPRKKAKAEAKADNAKEGEVQQDNAQAPVPPPIKPSTSGVAEAIDVDVEDMNAEEDTNAKPGGPLSARARPALGKAPSLEAPNDATGEAGHKARTRRKAPGTGTTSAQAELYDHPPGQPPHAVKSAGVPRGRGRAMGEGSADSDTIMEAVVKVFCIHTEPNFSLPWQRKRQYSSSSSGFIISGRRILTNAHCVDFFTQVKVKRRGSDEKFVASVLSVGAECDIAMLTVEDDAFWAGVEPVRFGQLPQLQDAVTVVGYPIGGDTMSVTSGVVSRIEVTSYVHGAAELLGIQIDAAINSGNSGGPAFNESGECVGIAFQSLKHEDAENIGYIIPTPVIEHFIRDYELHGKYTGFPCLGIEWQRMENPDLRNSLNMRPDQKGVLIRRIEPTSAASKGLKQYDVLMAFDGVPITNDGTVPFRSGERISFSYLVSQKYVGEDATLKVLSGGEQRTVTVTLQAPVRLIPFHTRGLPPTYFIIAGLVFTPVTVPYLRSEYGKEYDFDAPVKLLDKMMHAMAEGPMQQVVVLSQVLASDVNIGYEDILNTQVISLNGVKITNMSDLVAAVDGCKADYLAFDLDYCSKVVLNTAKAREATPDILRLHCIATDRSPDLPPPHTAAAPAGDKKQGEGSAAAQANGGEAAGSK